MATFGSYVPIIQTEAESLARFLDTLSEDDWQRPSACGLWAIRDVVAHLVWAADFYTDTVSRGIHGDISKPDDHPPGDAPDQASMPAYFHQHTIRMRDRLGTRLMPTFRSRFQALSNLMSGLTPKQWEMPCSFFHYRGGKQPANAFLFLIIQELAIHGWDIRSRFGKAASLSVESLPLLLERIPRRSGFSRFPIDSERWPQVRYRFDLSRDRALRYDLVVEDGTTRMEPSGIEAAAVTLHCDRSTFVLMMYKRLTLDSAVSQGHLSVEGDQALALALDQWLRQP